MDERKVTRSLLSPFFRPLSHTHTHTSVTCIPNRSSDRMLQCLRYLSSPVLPPEKASLRKVASGRPASDAPLSRHLPVVLLPRPSVLLPNAATMRRLLHLALAQRFSKTVTSPPQPLLLPRATHPGVAIDIVFLPLLHLRPPPC